MAARSKLRATTHDEYFAKVNAKQRGALQKLRKAIHAAAPKAVECISYQLAAFRHEGKVLVSFGATDKHCAFYVMSPAVMDAHKADLSGYDTSKGTIRFQAAKPLPVNLVRKLVKARIAENLGKGAPPGIRKENRRDVRMAMRTAAPAPDGMRVDPGVVAFMRGLKHPRKPELEVLRQIILAAGPDVREGIKWNSPSFRTSDWFATINVHAKDRIRLILHTGAKVKDSAKKGLQIADRAGLLQWLAKDRCLVSIGDAKDLQTKRAALGSILREWIRRL